MVIKVVTGIRRCGKSTLLAQYQSWLLNNGIAEEQILSINFEELEYEELQDYKKLYAYLKERLVPGKTTYIFLDEIQRVPYFEKAVDSIYVKPNVDVYITGSNSYLLSGDLATLLTGRYVEIKMLPLSFREFLEITKLEKQQGFTEYMRNGGDALCGLHGAHSRKSRNLPGGHLQYRYCKRYRRPSGPKRTQSRQTADYRHRALKDDRKVSGKRSWKPRFNPEYYRLPDLQREKNLTEYRSANMWRP